MTIHPAVRDGAILAGLLFAGYLFLIVAPAAGTFGFDAFAYWAVDPEVPYRRTAGGFGAFTYTPVAARAFAPASLLSWPTFLWLWLAVQIGTLVWLGRRRPRTILALLAFPPVALELYHGNVHLLIAAAIVLGFRHPWAWSLVVVTKVTPAIGLVWFAVRREWRSLGIALGVSAVLVAVSLVVDFGLWTDWLAAVTATAGGAPLNQFSIAVPLAVRLPIALAVVAWGAATDRRWTVPLAATLALPVLWPSGLAVLAAIAPLVTTAEPHRAPAVAAIGPGSATVVGGARG